MARTLAVTSLSSYFDASEVMAIDLFCSHPVASASKRRPTPYEAKQAGRQASSQQAGKNHQCMLPRTLMAIISKGYCSPLPSLKHSKHSPPPCEAQQAGSQQATLLERHWPPNSHRVTVSIRGTACNVCCRVQKLQMYCT
jgi:hypothetical protein